MGDIMSQIAQAGKAIEEYVLGEAPVRQVSKASKEYELEKNNPSIRSTSRLPNSINRLLQEVITRQAFEMGKHSLSQILSGKFNRNNDR